jgi:hypothetical protein
MHLHINEKIEMTNAHNPTHDVFLQNVDKHVMTIVKEDGLYRHLRFAQPGTRNQSFDIITSPGRLFFVGDMGDVLFERDSDMFDFFRCSTDELRIQASYWSEKVTAVGKEGVSRFSWDLFCENLRRWVVNGEDTEADAAALMALNEVLSETDQDSIGAQSILREYNVDFEDDIGMELGDFFEVSHDEYTTHYVWACYAIVWAVKQWDVLHAQVAKNATPMPEEVKVALWKAQVTLGLIQRCHFPLDAAQRSAEASFDNIEGDIGSYSPDEMVDEEIDAMQSSM